MPDTCDWGVPNAFRLGDLFASGLGAFVGGVVDGDNDFLDGAGGAFQFGSEVDAEAIEAAFVFANFFAIEEHFALPIDSAEVQEDPLALPGWGNSHGAAVPEAVGIAHSFSDA